MRLVSMDLGLTKDTNLVFVSAVVAPVAPVAAAAASAAAAAVVVVHHKPIAKASSSRYRDAQFHVGDCKGRGSKPVRCVRQFPQGTHGASTRRQEVLVRRETLCLSLFAIAMRRHPPHVRRQKGSQRRRRRGGRNRRRRRRRRRRRSHATAEFQSACNAQRRAVATAEERSSFLEPFYFYSSSYFYSFFFFFFFFFFLPKNWSLRILIFFFLPSWEAHTVTVSVALLFATLENQRGERERSRSKGRALHGEWAAEVYYYLVACPFCPPRRRRRRRRPPPPPPPQPDARSLGAGTSKESFSLGRQRVCRPSLPLGKVADTDALAVHGVAKPPLDSFRRSPRIAIDYAKGFAVEDSWEDARSCHRRACRGTVFCVCVCVRGRGFKST